MENLKDRYLQIKKVEAEVLTQKTRLEERIAAHEREYKELSKKIEELGLTDEEDLDKKITALEQEIRSSIEEHEKILQSMQAQLKEFFSTAS